MRLLLAMVAVFSLARSAQATQCDPAEAAELRAHLQEQSGKADTWNLVWRVSFTGAAVVTGVVGALDPFPSLRYGMYASAGKATIGAVARWIIPLKIAVPAPNSDPCADLAALRKQIKLIAQKERGMFWLGHIGGLLVNLGGAAYVWAQDGTNKALLSIAVGYPVGVISNYTMPRGTWKLYRERESGWNVTAVSALPRDDGFVLSLGGTF